MVGRREQEYALNGMRIELGQLGFFVAHTAKLARNRCQVSIREGNVLTGSVDGFDCESGLRINKTQYLPYGQHLIRLLRVQSGEVE